MLDKAARACTIESPCKINLHLQILDKRPDGFHNLESIFTALAFSDSIRIERTPQDEDYDLVTNWELPPLEDIPLEKNLITKAVYLFREKTGFNSGLKIHLDKRIPSGAGLGGGSSNAASVLIALNALTAVSLDHSELTKMALLLGSDVPFFLDGGAAYVNGRGEIIKPVKCPGSYWVLLVKPPIFSSTAEAFRLLSEARAAAVMVNGANTANKAVNEKTLISSLEKDPVTWPYINDFLDMFLDSEHAGVYRTILEELKRAGASFSGLSGAGSCCFGIFNDKTSAKKAKGLLEGNYTRLTFFLAQKTDPVLE